MTPRRHFLGWDAPSLGRAADWILSELGDELDGTLVVLPGSRAARRLLRALARRARPGWRPPQVVTQGQLVDQLVRLERPAAGRLLRTLAWEKALRSIGSARRERIARESGGGAGLRSRVRLAETVRTLHGELAPEGLAFERMTEDEHRPESAGEALRWEALAATQRRWREVLDELGVVDPHEARLAAIEAGAVDPDAQVVLVGVADMTQLMRRLLETIGDRTTVLIAAPEEAREGFDEYGGLVSEYWRERDVPLPLERWHVVEKPVDQADRLGVELARFGDRFAADEITIGVADDEVAPYLDRRLGEFGVTARHASGTSLDRTRPYQLLQASARYLDRKSYAEFAALVRHPDLDAHLRPDPDRLPVDPVRQVDRYYGKHLPELADGSWLGKGDAATGGVEGVHAALTQLFGELDGRRAARPLVELGPLLRGFLTRVYAAAEIDPETESGRVLGAALGLMGEGIDELEAIPLELGTEFTPSEGIELLLRQVRSRSVAPAPAEAGVPTIELLGWLELPFDEAPALVVTGFNEGRVPESVHGDAFLPDSVRRRLGLQDNDDRLARDIYTATLLMHSREEAVFISGRRSFDGDPLVPSRLAFHAPADEILDRVRQFLPKAERRSPSPELAPSVPAAEAGATPARELPRRAGAVGRERMSVSSFKTYLDSPYLYYLRYVLQLETLDDRARELEPLAFGNLVHDVLEVFGKSELRNSTDAEAIEGFLVSTARRELGRSYGAPPLPAIRLQAEQLEFRFGIFARKQAQRASEGWRIVHAEWKPASGAVPLVVDGTPVLISGKIDRVDHHPTRGWAILDYKTGENSDSPEKTHGGRDGVWRDLQLPLYCHLAQELEIEELPQLGYVTLGRDEQKVKFQLASKWDEDTVESALAAAADVVRAVRKGDFFRTGKRPLYEPVLRGLAGEGLMDAEDGA